MTSDSGIRRRESVAAVLVADDGILLQLRDDIEGIEYPGYWSLFAGWIERGETPVSALHRELCEEIEAEGGICPLFDPLEYLGSVQRSDRPWTEHVFISRVITPVSCLRIREGRELRAFTVDECKCLDKLAPHHWQHLCRFRREIESELSDSETKR